MMHILEFLLIVFGTVRLITVIISVLKAKREMEEELN